MALNEYRKKRKFKKTPEPKGKIKKEKGKLKFVVQKHNASHLHYDLRLELNGILKSWAVPKGPSLNPNDKRLAILVEDHPLDYLTFEGIIPKGNYGAGTVMVWDIGTYKPIINRDIQPGHANLIDEQITQKEFKKGHLTFILDGKKLKGEFALTRIRKNEKENWLLIKKKDEFASDKKITDDDYSVLTKKTSEEIRESDPELVYPEPFEWVSESFSKERSRNKFGMTQDIDLQNFPKGKMPHNIKPMLANLSDKPFADPNWVFEVKWDGYRAIAEIDKTGVKLYSRNLLPFNFVYPEVENSLKKINHEAVLDGEIVVVDKQGVPRFQLLQAYQKEKKGNLIYYLFDIIYLDGHDLKNQPLVKRKEILNKILPNLENIKISDYIEKDGIEFLNAAAKQGLEGIIGKRKESVYKIGQRTKAWLKIKNLNRQEAVIAGFTKPRGGRKYFGALVLGIYKNNELIYVGHSGGGFDDKSLAEIYHKLKPLITKNSPFKNPPKTNMPVTWVEPKLVAEIEFSQWTNEMHMRQPVFLGLRIDRSPKEVTFEKPVDQQNVIRRSPQAPKVIPTFNKDYINILIDKHKLKLTNLNKVFWPDEGYTKKNLIDYYFKISDFILPYLKERPESLHRFPNGINGERFFQKNVDHLPPPDWIKTVEIYSESYHKNVNYMLCQDKASLIYMINLGCIEVNPWNSRIQNLDKPDYLVIDLDPEDISFDYVVQTAIEVKNIFDKLSISSYCKTSGARGLHIYVPLNAKYSYEQARQFGQIIANLTHEKLPEITSIERRPSKRQKKVYVDFLQNNEGATMASVYSVRPKPDAPVSTPLKWEEVKKGLDPKDFTIKTIFKRLDKIGDIFKPVLGEGIDMEKILNELA